MLKIKANRIFLISDTHLGVRSNSREWMDIIEDYFKNKFIPLLKKEYKPGDILVHCGDVFDSRQSINLYILNKGLEIFEEIAEILPVHMIIGNHDIFMKYSNEINSLKIFKHLKNIHIYHQPTVAQIGSKKALFMPWVDTAEEFMEIIKEPNNKADIMFCHTDIQGMSFNKFTTIDEGANPDKFANFDRVYSGHIHYAQKYKNVRMLGCPYELTRSDSGNKKSIWLYDLDTDTEAEFQNDISPKFVKYKLEWLLEQPIGSLQELFYNNFVDVIISPQWSIKFPISTFNEKFSGYRKINYIISDHNDNVLDDESETLLNDHNEEISLTSLIDKHIETLPYSENIKESLKKISNKFYQETLKEIEEKRLYETQQ